MSNVKPCTRRYRKKFHVVEIPCLILKNVRNTDIIVDDIHYNMCSNNRLYIDKILYERKTSKLKHNIDRLKNSYSKFRIRIYTDGGFSVTNSMSLLLTEKCYLLFDNKHEYLKWKLKYD